ncbi:MAG: ABC transporter permease [Nitrospiraceae bacterium]|nr:MAG: ABC transporter permease [Nitrospiraceae bacterium]
MKADEQDVNKLSQGLAVEVSRFSEAWRIFRKNRLALWGMVIFILFFVVALSGLVLTYGDDPVLDPSKVRMPEKLLAPLSTVNREMVAPEDWPAFGVYLLGTDDLGRDVFARMMQGAWVSLTVGFVAVGIAVAIGLVLGGIAGYYGMVKVRLVYLLCAAALCAASVFLFSGQGRGAVYVSLGALFILGLSYALLRHGEDSLLYRVLSFDTIGVDTLIMRFVDIMLCFPAFFLILTVVAILPPSIYNIMVVIGLTGWMGTTRFVRAEFLSLREQDFVSAAKVMGISDTSIIFRHMIPNAIAPVLVSATIGIASAILTEAGLSFLGFGVPPPHATWGNILSDGKRFLFDAPWLTYIPGLSILVIVLSFNLFGEGLRDALNPKLRKR